MCMNTKHDGFYKMFTSLSKQAKIVFYITNLQYLTGETQGKIFLLTLCVVAHMRIAPYDQCISHNNKTDFQVSAAINNYIESKGNFVSTRWELQAWVEWMSLNPAQASMEVLSCNKRLQEIKREWQSSNGRLVWLIHIISLTFFTWTFLTGQWKFKWASVQVL